MAIFNSYVCLPEGKLRRSFCMSKVFNLDDGLLAKHVSSEAFNNVQCLFLATDVDSSINHGCWILHKLIDLRLEMVSATYVYISIQYL